MRTPLIRFAILALAVVSFAGCTTSTQTTTRTDYDQTTKKVYTKEELEKRGQQTVPDSLAAQDEQITITHNRGR
jgi:hypothetical protein